MILDRLFNFNKPKTPAPDALQVGAHAVPLLIVCHPRARRYLLRLRPDGTACVTMPRHGSISAAREFAARNLGWLAQQFQRLASRPRSPATWRIGSPIQLRGQPVRIEAGGDGSISFGAERLEVAGTLADLRPVIQGHLRRLATRELPARVRELAAAHEISVTRVTIRNQKTRWGSCSRRGTISLNWRLIQAPDFVRDYIILHELAHRRQMNHSTAFWEEVEKLCPDYRAAERWLKHNARLLG